VGIGLPPHALLVAVYARGAILDYGAEFWRFYHGRIEAVPPDRDRGHLPVLAWVRGRSLVGVSAEGGSVSITPGASPAPASPVVRIGDALFYTTGTALAHHDVTRGTGAPDAALGKDYLGALGGDSRTVVVGDRDAIWTWDPGTGRRRVISQAVYWPGALAIHPTTGAILADQHGHGAAVLAPDGTVRVLLAPSSVWPTGWIGWLGDSAILTGDLIDLVSEDAVRRYGAGETVTSAETRDWKVGVDAILCWGTATRAANTRDAPAEGRLRRLIQTERGVQLCDLRASGAMLAWIELPRDLECGPDAPSQTLVTARVTGTCE
jgi:hypothetical protein